MVVMYQCHITVRKMTRLTAWKKKVTRWSVSNEELRWNSTLKLNHLGVCSGMSRMKINPDEEKSTCKHFLLPPSLEVCILTWDRCSWKGSGANRYWCSRKARVQAYWQFAHHMIDTSREKLKKRDTFLVYFWPNLGEHWLSWNFCCTCRYKTKENQSVCEGHFHACHCDF